MSNPEEMSISIDRNRMHEMAALSVGAALLAGIYPARRAARNSPAAVLRND